MHRFYIPKFEIDEKSQELSSEDAYHAVKVVRLEDGDTVEGFDGKGILIKGNIKILQESSKKFRVFITDFNKSSKEISTKPKVTLIVSTFKLDRLEWAIEKCTELGVDEIIITQSKFSQITLEKIEKKFERLEAIVMNACKQSQNLILPIVRCSKSKELLETYSKSKDSEIKFIATTEIKSTNLRELLKGNTEKGIVILIGPEGGFEKDELDEIISCGFNPCNLSENILRAETACVVAVYEVIARA